jgi:glycosyltransferase involved in cell wall biosynthesis
MTKAQPLITVIITNYNYGDYVEKAIQSVIDQTYKNIELIIINDGSTDNSNEIIKRALEGQSSARYINQRNQGANISRNKGMDLANGDYILLLDADNWLNIDHVEKLYQTALHKNSDVIYCDLQHFDGDSRLHEMPDFNLEYLKVSNFVDTSSRKAIGKVKFNNWLNRRFLQDYDFFLGLALKGLSFSKCPNTSVNYRVHGKQNGNKRTPEKLEQFVENYNYIIEKYRRLYPKEFNPSVRLGNELLVNLISTQRDVLIRDKEITELQRQNTELKQQSTELQRQNTELKQSTSWRVTKPLRYPKKMLKIVLKK